MAPMEGARSTAKASVQPVWAPISRRRLISLRPMAAIGPTSAKPETSGNSSGIML